MEGIDIRKHAQRVFDEIGTGYVENIYSKALQRQLSLEEIDIQSETVIPVKFRGADIGFVRSDITILPNGPILELKAINGSISEVEIRQLKNYLKLTGFKVGYVINFPQPSRALSKVTNESVEIVRVT